MSSLIAPSFLSRVNNRLSSFRTSRKRRLGLFLAALCVFAATASVFFYVRARAATTYTWNQPGTAAWDTSTNWTPTRTTPATDDILVFNNGASTTVTNVSTQTIGQLQVSNNTAVTLQANPGGVTIT